MKRKSQYFGEESVMIRGIHLAALSCFAIAQPVFDLLGRQLEFFVARQSEPVDFFLLGFALCAIPPGVILVLEYVAGRVGPRERSIVHTLGVALLLLLIALPPLNRVEGLPEAGLLAIAVLWTALGTMAYVKSKMLRSYVGLLGWVVLLFPGIFLFHAANAKLLDSPDASPAVGQMVTETPIVMVIFDELPLSSLLDERARIDPVRYPNFARLERGSYWFRNATTVAANSLDAVPAILTGQYPDNRKLATAAYHPNNLFTGFAGALDLEVFETQTRLCPPHLNAGSREPETLRQRMALLLSDVSIVYLALISPESLRSRLPVVTQTWKGFASPNRQLPAGQPMGVRVEFGANPLAVDRAALFEAFLRSIQASERPRLYFLHVMLPHVPWIYLPSGQTYDYEGFGYVGIDGLTEEERWSKDEWAVMQGYQRHLLQVGYVDRLLGRLIERLQEVGLYDSCLLVVTADHGVSFIPGKYRRPVEEANYADIASIPLFIKRPGQREGITSDRKVENVDILPTLSGMLGIWVPWPTDGINLLDPGAPEPDKRRVYSEVEEAGDKVWRKFSFTDLAGKQAETLKRKLTLFGSGRRPLGLYRIGPFAELIGQTAEQVGLVGQANLRVMLEGAESFTKVDPAGSSSPNPVRGRVIGPLANNSAVPLAISVNGKIAAMTQLKPQQGRVARFSAMVPPPAYRKGSNVVEIFVVRMGPDGQPRLMQMKEAEAGGYRLLGTGPSGEVSLLGPTGETIAVRPGIIKGSVQLSRPGQHRPLALEGYVALSGWTADLSGNAPPESIVIFVGNKLIFVGQTAMKLSDLRSIPEGLPPYRAEFYYEFPRVLFENADPADLHLFAVSSRGVAWELPVSGL